MRKLAQYRRNTHPNSGFKEKVAWQLSKGPRTGRELSAFFHMTLGEFNGLMRGCLRGKTAVIEATEPVQVGSCTDYTYTLVSTSRVTPSRPQTMLISRRSLAERGEDKRQQNIIAAEKRARLIKRGWYQGCLD